MERFLADDGEEDFTLWRENLRAFELFLALRTQWRTGALGGALGLDYCAVESVMRIHNVKDTRSMFDDMRAMEAAALPVLNEAKRD